MIKKLLPFLIAISFMCGCTNGDISSIENKTNSKEIVDISLDNKNTKLSFADPVFEKYFRITINKLSGDITIKDTSDIRQILLDNSGFNISYENYDKTSESRAYFNSGYLKGDEEYPYSLEDLKFFENLEWIRIETDPVLGKWVANNIDFVGKMPNLIYAYIDGSPHDLSALKNCTKLEYLAINIDQVTDYSVIKNLTSLKCINIISGVDDDEKEQINQKIEKYLPSSDVIIEYGGYDYHSES